MRVALFFDGKNFYSGWRASAADRRVGFGQLASWLVEQTGGRLLWGAYYYTGEERGAAADTDGQRKLASFLSMLELEPGFFVSRFPRKARSHVCKQCGAENRFTTEKEVDTTIVADMLRLAAVGAFDIAVLVAGDSDHAPAVEGVRTLGKQVYVATWGGHGLSPRIRRAAFDHIDLMNGLDKFAPLESGREPAAHPREIEHPAPIGEVEASADAAFLAALKRAEAYFRDGFVGVNYFLTKWQSDGLDSSSEVRGRILDRLVETQQVETFDAANGNRALRVRGALTGC